jgi:hypothetical protein
MARKVAFLLFAGIALLMCSPHISSAASVATPASIDQPALAADAFMAQAVVTTSVFTVHQCGCQKIVSCPFTPIGTDCAEPPGCCHCGGADPATRACQQN